MESQHPAWYVICVQVITLWGIGYATIAMPSAVPLRKWLWPSDKEDKSLKGTARVWLQQIMVYSLLSLPLVVFAANNLIAMRDREIDSTQRKIAEAQSSIDDLNNRITALSEKCNVQQVEITGLKSVNEAVKAIRIETSPGNPSADNRRWDVAIHDPSEMGMSRIDIEIRPLREIWRKPIVLVQTQERDANGMTVAWGDMGGMPMALTESTDYTEYDTKWTQVVCEDTLNQFKSMYLLGSELPSRFRLLIAETNETVEFKLSPGSKSYNEVMK